MKTMRALMLVGFAIATMLVLFILLVGPVDTSPGNCREVSGIVLKIEERATKDIVFTIKGNPYTYYINRGLEQGLDLKVLESRLVGQEITLWHAGTWLSKGGHIAQLVHEDDILFTEWER